MTIAPVVPVEQVILTIRGHRVILSSDLAEAYGVEARVLNQAVNRNAERFPPDFAFRLTREEAVEVQRSRSRTVIMKRGQNMKYLPLAFTEHGAIMAASVLNSPRAVQMSIFVVRAFLKLRELAAGQTELTARLTEIERRVGEHDQELQAVIQALRELLQPTDEPPASRDRFRAAGRGEDAGERGTDWHAAASVVPQWYNFQDSFERHTHGDQRIRRHRPPHLLAA